MKIVDLFKNKPIPISNRLSPYVIAEAGVNHEGKMEIAKKLIDQAKEGGAHAIKFQTYRAATIASKHSPAYWDLSKEPTTSQYELFKKYDKFWKDEFEQLKKYCDQVSIEFMSTPFDKESAFFLNDLMNVFKISSSDITNKPFIELICKFGKPILLSTGASNIDEIYEATKWIEKQGNKLALLHCILNYPTNEDDANLGMILSLKKSFPGKLIGYSDHTMPGQMKVLELAALFGAVILEKHFTHDKSLPGNDHYHAMNKEDLKVFWENLGYLQRLSGDFEKRALESEQSARKNARRSLIAKRRIAVNQIIEFDDLTWKRPASGISPKEIEKVVGKKATKDILIDDVIKWEMFS